MKLALVVAAATAVSLGASAACATVSARDPNSIVSVMQAAGYQAALTKDSVGDPLIKSASSGSTFWINFYGCKSNRDCTNIQFMVSYNTSPANTPSLAKLNDWNRDSRWASVFLTTDDDPCLQMDVDLDADGMSDALFKDNLDFWTKHMSAFEKHIGWTH